MKLAYKKIENYGLHAVHSYYVKPKSVEEVIECILYASKNNLRICPLGGAMSFSDVCLITGQICLDITTLNRIINFDHKTGILVAQAGVLTTEILQRFMPMGWYLSGVSGSLHNTIAGDISNNTNGKDSWKYGNFGANVLSMKVCLADGSISDISDENNQDLFNSVIGGMGLLCIITEVTLQLKRIPSFMVEVKSERQESISKILKKIKSLDEQQDDFFYSWIDPYPQNNSLGRGVSETARFVENTNSISIEAFEEGLHQKKRIGFLPPVVFWNFIRLIESQSAVRIANILKYNLSEKEGQTKTVTFPDYQFPLIRKFPDWNMKLKPKGWHELQMIYSENVYEEAFAKLLSICRRFNFMPQICAVRKHKSDPYYLSFAKDGYSITINYPLSVFTTDALQKITGEIIETCLRYGGIIYLGKYPYITADECRDMYTDYQKFIEVRNNYNPNLLFSSDAAKRLFNDLP